MNSWLSLSQELCNSILILFMGFLKNIFDFMIMILFALWVLSSSQSYF